MSVFHPSRRTVLAGLAGLPGALALSSRARAQDALKDRAARKGLFYGAAVQIGRLTTDTAYREAVTQQAAVVVPEWEMKWGALEAMRGRPDYTRADALMRFASEQGWRVRGHALVWFRNTPPWLKADLPADEVRRSLLHHVERTARRYRGRMFHWDVVNEALEPKDGRPGGLRKAVFGERLGDGYIDDAFHAAGEADPEARLYYNDYGLDYADGESEARRRATLAFLEDRVARKVPIHGLGIQAHLQVGRTFEVERYRRFLREIAATGVEIVLTELDVKDRRLPPDIALRDRAVADHAKAFLDAALDERAVRGVVTWGITDRYSWLSTTQGSMRDDGRTVRGLPLDEDLRPKPLWHAMAEAFDHAPAR